MKKAKTAVAVLLSTSLLFGCSQKNEEATTKKEETKEVAKDALDGVTAEYREYAINEIEEFVIATEEFTNAVIEGDVEKAKELYAPARMHYERAEPIAEVFGDLDPKIDAREGDVPEDEWTGYHRIEYGLWEKNTTKGYEEYAEQLMKDVHLLRAKVETVEVTPDLLVTGAVDLLNEVSTSKVTGEEDRYSHTDLYDFVANVQGAEEIFNLLKDEVKAKDADLAATIEAQFAQVHSLLDQQKEGDGYKLYTDLTEAEVKKFSQAVDALAEPLSQIGIVTEAS
ncbi:EfeM/EfeO family lipoprotein [Peribacillus asahii]|uniref:EfeM/EfeO family lipoprotein n=1 Tax=Peribacillus asahii TaxID=228899 RepID=A0A398B8B7_9BACI|nr:iron uptake system protein EfeO [Peribacillus asahii]RID85078.1 EfeM/EfeO family lipoprotein [Peribacillus asahii]